MLEEEREPSTVYWVDHSCAEEDTTDLSPDSEQWKEKELHLFIVTDAGKPVYSRYGSVQRLTPILCTCVAIIGHMDALQEELNHFKAGSNTFVFLPHSPFIFIAVSKSSLPVSYLFKQLNFLYYLFLSLFSENLINQLSMRPQSDFRQIAEGTKPAWDGVVNIMSDDPAFIFAPGVPTGYLPTEERQQVSRRLNSLQNCILSMLMYRNRVLAIGHNQCDPLSLRLIIDLAYTPAFQDTKGSDSWTPFFLRDSTDGMHHLYISQHRSNEPFIVALSSDTQGLPPLHADSNQILQALSSIAPSLNKSVGWTPAEFKFWVLNIPSHGQVFVTNPPSELPGGQDVNAWMKDIRQELAKSYDMVYENGSEGEFLFRGEANVVVVNKTSSMEFYAIASSKDLPNRSLSEKINELKNFVTSNIGDFIISDTKISVPKLV